MGIEPTWDFVESHTGFEDQERHQVAPHLHAGPLRRRTTTSESYFRRAESREYWDTIQMQIQSESISAIIGK